MADLEKKETAGIRSPEGAREQGEAGDRRSFLKSGVAAVTVVAGGLSAAEAQPQPGRDTARKLTGVVHVHFPGKTPLRQKQVEDLLAEIYKLSGCDHCGQTGFDVLLTRGDPAELSQIRGARVFAVEAPH
jgi:hypothetical protein